MKRKVIGTAVLSLSVIALATLAQAKRPQPSPPCHPNATADMDMAMVRDRGDIRHLPGPLRDRLVQLAGRPHSQLPTQAYAEAHFDKPPFKPKASQLFQYYLLDTTGFEANPFTSSIPGVNDTAMLTATGPDCGLPTLGSVRVVLEPKPDLPTDPNDVRAFIDIFTDVSGLFVINNESGWYEGWMIHDLTVAPVNDTPRSDGHAQFGTILQADADALSGMGAHHDVPGNIFTSDGNAEHFPGPDDRFPDSQTNVVPIQLSMGAWNTLQQSDGHAYWEFNYTTNWIHPLYELPFTWARSRPSFPARGRTASRTTRCCTATTRTTKASSRPPVLAIPTSSMRTTTRSANSASGSFRAAWPTRSSSTFLSAWLPSSRASATSTNDCSMPTPRRWRGWIRTTTASSRPLKATWIPPRTDSPTTRACSSRRRSSSASR